MGAQINEFLKPSGQVVQFCAGPCDPNQSTSRCDTRAVGGTDLLGWLSALSFRVYIGTSRFKSDSPRTRRRSCRRRKPHRRALSLHLGLNAVDPAHYAGWGGELSACEFDAKDMAALAKSRKMKPTILLTKKATRKAALAAMRAAAKALGVRRSLLPHLLGPRRSGGRRDGRGRRQARRDLVPVRRRADRRRALPGAQPLRGRRPRARALGQLPQRNGDSRQTDARGRGRR